LPAALRALARGGYLANRVFFLDEATAIAAGYRPCEVCLVKEITVGSEIVSIWPGRFSMLLNVHWLKRLRWRNARSTAQRYGRGLGYENAASRPQSNRSISDPAVRLGAHDGKKSLANAGPADARSSCLER